MWEQESDYLPGANKVKSWLVRLPFDTELKGTWAEKHVNVKFSKYFEVT